VDTSLFEAGIQQTYWQSAIFFATGAAPGPSGSAHILSAPYQAFRASDGWLNIGGANQANWERLTRVLGAPEWTADERFRTNGDRMKNLQALTALMNARLSTRSVQDWISALKAKGVPCGPIHSIADMAADPKPRRALGLLIELSATPGIVTRAAPLTASTRGRCWANSAFRLTRSTACSLQAPR